MILNKTVSTALLRYYLGPDHPAKIRIWGWWNKALGYPRYTIPYAGGWTTIDLRDDFQVLLLTRGEYEPEVWENLIRDSRPGEIVWDVGAHIGGLAHRASQHLHVAQVHCFEPNSRTRSVLEHNLKLNAFNTFIHPYALSDREEEIDLFLPPETNIGVASLEKDWGGGTERVRTLTADQLISRKLAPSPTLMKVDVEHWEERLFAGAENLLASGSLKRIVFETSVTREGKPLKKSLFAALEKQGYRCQLISSGPFDVTANFLATR